MLCPRELAATVVLAVVLGPAVTVARVGDGSIDLDRRQEAWLRAHPVVRVAFDPAFAPVEFRDAQGEYRGMGADYLKLVERRLGLRFEVRTPKDWREALDLSRRREVDLLPAAADTAHRREYLAFTAPHIRIPAVLITARSDSDEWDEETMRRLRIAVVAGYAWDDWIQERFADARLFRVPDIEVGLQSTSFGLADVMVGDLATTSYFIGKTGITNLRVARQLDRTLDLAMAVRSDWPILRDILDRVIVDIGDDERQAITATWIHLQQPAWWQNRTFRLVALWVLGSFGALIVGTFGWNRALQRQVERRTRELKETQLRLIRAAKLESVGRLAAGVAHEVKNPLAVLQMGVDFLAPDLPANSDGAAVLADMRDAVRRADTVIKGLLDFSRDKKLDVKPDDPNQVIHKALRLVGHELGQRHIDVRLDLDENLPRIPLDADKLEQVFINLFTNACHAMDRDGTLSVRSYVATPRGRLASARRRRSTVVLEVADTGPGIPPEKLGHVFDPFFTTKPIGEGTGLGLSVCRNIVELHNGSIEIRNRAEGGAVVTIVLKIP